MRRPMTLASRLGGPALLALLAPAATAQETIPPPGRPVTLPPPATAQEVEATTPATTLAPATAPAQVVTPAPVTETVEDQDQQDRQLAGAMTDPAAIGPNGVTLSIPSGWVRIAIDRDNDGTFDAVETINADALLQARRMSIEHRGQGQGAVADPAGDPDSMGAGGDQGLDEIRLSGTVQDLQEFRLAGYPTPHRLARLETDQGIAKVDLGPADALQSVGIDRGEEITVVGHRGMINDRPVLMAREVTRGDQSAAIESPDDRMLKRVRGEVRNLRTASFRTRDEEHLIAEVELRSGDQAEVILGPKARLADLDLARGTQLSLLVRPARLNGRDAMVAEQVRAGDQTVSISDPIGSRPEVETKPGSESDVPDAPEPSDSPDASGSQPALKLDPDN